ncbi:NAD(P)-dependent oxidoreductase [Nocardia cyriacigeorgica]|uniref:NAD(P)-dependent oxidoreductase n=1 Tax=Nocardia cyriacigeorgica TaxID=135487 RepID=UPI0024906ED2|nr:NAD(P)-binding domain-containing protein [Nocardia cyriacigeorgica]BDT85948.1 oxidoreductase [Nocardia cyriacigeorgica]
MSEPRTVAILGAGIMANAVAARLDAHGFELRRYNCTTAAIDGPAIVCASAAQAAEEAPVVWSFVHDDTASEAVWLGPEGALAAANGAVVIESSTLSPEYAQRWMSEAAAAGARPVLAPVTGSRVGAENGTLVAFTSGAAADLAAADRLLRIIAAEVVQIGDAGATATVKLLNNALAAVILTGLAETFTAAAALGLDIAQLMAVWSRHGWAAPVASAYGAAMLGGEHDLTNCSLAVIAKDLRHATAVLGDVPAPLITAAAEKFGRALQLGLGDREMSAIVDAIGARP